MGAIRAILREKGNLTHSISPNSTVFQALEMMFEKNIGAVMVTENEKILGIFSERDYARKVIIKGRSSRTTRIREVMTLNVITVSPNSGIDDCMQLMADKSIRHLPVVESDRLVGLISIGDLVKYIIDDQKFIIEHMEHYTGQA